MCNELTQIIPNSVWCLNQLSGNMQWFGSVACAQRNTKSMLLVRFCSGKTRAEKMQTVHIMLFVVHKIAFVMEAALLGGGFNPPKIPILTFAYFSDGLKKTTNQPTIGRTRYPPPAAFRSHNVSAWPTTSPGRSPIAARRSEEPKRTVTDTAAVRVAGEITWGFAKVLGNVVFFL